MIFAFWTAAGLVLYTYLGYPLLLWVLTLGRRRQRGSRPPEPPSVSLIVTAYNEQAVLRDKLDNTFALDYPADRLQVVVVSDGSTDATDDVARSYEGRPGYVFLRQEPNAGKTAAQNAAVRAASGDVLVFSDANSMYAPDALRRLVARLADGVGCVCGELRYTNPEGAGAGEGEGYYWRYEQFLKRRESLLGALVGANGSIYALRRELFEELDPRIISDFILPLRLRRRGHRVIYAPEAVAVEESGRGFGEELRRRRRIVARSLYGLWREAGALNPFAHPLLAFQIVSHKLVRWLVPVLLMVLLGTGAAATAAEGEPYRTLLAAQVVLYGLALVGGLFPRWCGRMGLFYLPAYFCAINIGALLGLLGALRGERHTVWKPVTRPDAD